MAQGSAAALVFSGHTAAILCQSCIGNSSTAGLLVDLLSLAVTISFRSLTLAVLAVLLSYVVVKQRFALAFATFWKAGRGAIRTAANHPSLPRSNTMLSPAAAAAVLSAWELRPDC